MKRDYLLETIDECTKLNGVPYSFFISYRECDNIISNRHGKFSELKPVLDDVEKSRCCIEGELPFIELAVYYNSKVIFFRENENWDCVDGESYESHFVDGIPLMDMDGNWLYLNGSCDTVHLTDEELLNYKD
jgi:hypothetical protein